MPFKNLMNIDAMHTEKLDIFGPLAQSRRCLDQWLSEEGRIMPERLKRRTAALIARYFYHEDELNDQLLLSFLRHYSGQGAMDIEDPSAVRMEIGNLLGQSSFADNPSSRLPLYALSVTAAVMAVMIVSHIAGWTITPAQQNELKVMVERVSLAERRPAAAVWTEIKKPLGVRRYQDISYWDYRKVRARVADRSRAGM
jgi:hypothetical protein